MDYLSLVPLSRQGFDTYWTELEPPKRLPARQTLHTPIILILARCVFVTQTTVCHTKTLAPQGRINTPKSYLES
ncbi:hypothetical protein E4P48_08370 [Porphyromonas levii]|uniref:Uncharacterized protein n=1 Tax=Porphyromonas levii TaxID=28114 RepID=A0A4Y8WPG9_9PORP|nr:hypothetical protein E4P48_08370 [Porphyromonas levii]TFH95484.1 hypothetical protein E4P47_04355 [Porphyromonas levii]